MTEAEEEVEEEAVALPVAPERRAEAAAVAVVVVPERPTMVQHYANCSSYSTCSAIRIIIHIIISTIIISIRPMRWRQRRRLRRRRRASCSRFRIRWK